MRIAQLAALAVLVLFAPLQAGADDTRIIVGSGDPPPGACNVKLPSFTVNPSTKGSNIGGGIFDCVNDTGENWIGLEITGKTKVSGDTLKFGSGVLPFACDGLPLDTNSADIFTTCTIISQSMHSITFTLTGGAIPDGDTHFFVDLSTDGDHAGSGKGGWEGLLTIAPIATPEPGEMALLLIGLGGVWVCARRKTAKSIN